MAVEVVGGDRGVGRLGSELAANCRNMGETALAGSLVEPELNGQVGDCQQCELLGGGGGVFSLTLRHTRIIAKGCDTVVG
jgi:hypothetical protein